MTDRPVDLSFLKDEAVKYIDLSSLRIANCVGCFGCWTKTPGKCVIRDDATWVYPCIAASDTVLYVSRLCYGGYDSVMKTMLERAIPVQQAFIRIYKGETHHVQCAVIPKKATILAYGDISSEEKELFWNTSKTILLWKCSVSFVRKTVIAQDLCWLWEVERRYSALRSVT